MDRTIPAGRSRPTPRRPPIFALLAVLAALVAAWVVPASAHPPAGFGAPRPGQLSQPPNVGDAKLAATAYHDSGAYAPICRRSQTTRGSRSPAGFPGSRTQR